jgi:transketolase
MNAIPFDTLKLAQDLRDNAGMSAVHAEGMVKALAAAFDGEVATRADVADVRREIQDLRAAMDQRFAKFEAATDQRFAKFETATDQRFAKFEAATDQRFAKFEAATDQRFAKFEAAMDQRFAKVEAGIASLEHRMTIRLGGMMIVAVGAVATLVKLL